MAGDFLLRFDRMILIVSRKWAWRAMVSNSAYYRAERILRFTLGFRFLGISGNLLKKKTNVFSLRIPNELTKISHI